MKNSNLSFFIQKRLRSIQPETKILAFLVFSFFFFLMNPLFAQTAGETCNAPLIVTSLPYSHTGNTIDYGNDYSNNDVAPIASGAVTTGSGSEFYLSGYDVVYELTPIIDGNISIETTNQNDWIGLWVFTDCPFSSTVGYHTSTSGATRSINNLPVNADQTYYIVISSWDSQISSTDFTIDIEGSDGLLTPLDDCTEAIAGDVTGPSEVCSDINFQLSVENSSASATGLIRQWQSSADGNNWDDIEGATGISLSSSISEDTYFRFVVTCDDEEDISDSFLVTLKPANECYCIPGGTNSNYYINDFTTTGGIENIENLGSGYSADGYGDFTEDHKVSQVHTETVNFQANFASGNTFGTKIWVDWNQDGIFSDDEIVYQSSSYTTSASGSFEVPESAVLGETRMRIGISYTPAAGPNDPCEVGSREFEDYTFEVLPLEDCEGPVTAGTVDTEMSVCSAMPVHLVSEGASDPANGLSRIWQSSPAGEDDWTDIQGSNSNDFTFQDGITEPTDFRYKVICNDEDPQYSDIIEVTLKPADECYCIPGGTNVNYYINDFTTTGGIENIENLGSGYSADGYGDFTEDHKVSQVHTETVDFQANFASGNTFGTKIWVDWNQDGIFSEDEIVYQSSSYTTSASGSFEVPESAVLGETRMRIGISYTPATGPNDPCEVGSREFEDYTFEVLPLEDCEGPVTAGTVDTDMSVCPTMPVHLVSEGASDPANGLIRIWQSSPAGEDDWTDIQGSNSNDFTFQEGITEPTDFRYKVVCNDEDPQYSDIIEVTLKSANECYCIPGGTNVNYYINDFTTTGGIENIENLGSGYSADGYGDFTEDHKVSQVHTETVDFQANFASGNTFGTKIWVDWNQDGIFSDDEIVYQSSSYTTSASGSFEVPESAVLGETRMRIGISYTPATGPSDPCEVGSREFEDYTFEVLPLEDCEGTPTAGTVDTDMSVCPAMPIHLVTEGASDPANGLVRIWQSSPAGEDDWTDIQGSNSNDFTFQDGITEPTDFRYKVVCNDEDPQYSDIIEVTLKPAVECYCTPPAPTYSDLYWIESVSTNNGILDISNLNTGSSPNGYGDYSQTHSLVVAPGQDFDFEVKSQNGSSPGLKIWIDWNQNGSFEDSGELVFDSSSGSSSNLNTYTGTISVPNDAPFGEARMRIRNYTGQTPCNQLSYGETEDYKVEIIQLEDCEGPVTAGTIEDDFEVCAGIGFNISVSGATDPASGLIRQWQSSPAGEDDWSDIENAHSSNLNLSAGIMEDTDFRFSVTCDDESDISDVITVSLKPANECYCIPEGTNASRYIKNFSTTGAIDNISNLNSGFSTGGYGDFTSMIVSQENTQDVSFSVDIEGGTAGFRIWIDWNQDGQFSADEVVYQSSAYASSHSGSFTVPEDIDPGQTRMRIVSHWLSTTGDINPCETGFTYGEFEDYTFEVIALEDCEGTPIAGTPDETQLEVCAGTSFTVSVSGASGAANNLYRRWQSSPAGENNWTNITGSSSQSFVVQNGIQEATDFRYALTCGDGDDVFSDIISVTLKPGNECYCTPPAPTYSDLYWIQNVSTSDAITNLSNLNTGFSTGGYGDYTDSHILTVIPGGSFDFEVQSQNGASPGLKIWIDWNQNGSFEDSGELVYESSSGSSSSLNTYSGSITVPANASLGSTRMRIRNYTGQEPCNQLSYGETEDYTVMIIIPDCFPAVNIAVSYITDNSALVTWDANDETAWVLTYGEAGFDPETEGTEILVDDSPSVELTDLDDDSTYDIYIQTLCEEEDSMLMGPVQFTTNISPPINTRLCDAIALQPNNGCIGGPYTNVAAFEEVNEPIGSCLNDYRGRNTVWFTFEAPFDGIATINTDFNSTEFLTEIVAYEAPVDCEDMSSLGPEVGCANAASGGILELEGLTPGDTYYVKVGGFNSSGGLFCIEVQMDETPICLPPTDITVDEPTHESALVTWTATGSASQWEVAYGTPGFDPDNSGDSMTVNIPEANITGLEAETDYEVYVRSLCAQSNSQWSEAETFTTEEMSVDKQVFADFTFYPNPVEDLLTLKAGTPIESIEIFNLLGQKVFEAKPNTTEVQVDAEGLQSGVYLMNIQLSGSQKSFRIIKK